MKRSCMNNSEGIYGMVRIAIHGWAAVFTEEEQVTDDVILRRLDGIAYDEEFFTDFLGDSSVEVALATALERGGNLRFQYSEGRDVLAVVTEYQAKRPLSDDEMRKLGEFTLAQWSDGIGENFTCMSADRHGYTVMCLDEVEGEALYPRVQVLQS